MRTPTAASILALVTLLCSVLPYRLIAAPVHKEANNHAALNAALLVAAAKGDAPQVKCLLASGADVDTRRGPDARSAVDMTPLMLAAVGTHLRNDNLKRLDTVNILLAHGANINASCTEGFTPLIWAVWGGNARVVRLLIRRGADVNANYPAYDITPLAVATSGCYSRIAHLLRRAGAKNSPPPPMPP